MPTADYRRTPVQSPDVPSGIPYIIGNEAAERFSYYGMRAILVTFMTKYIMNASGSQELMTDDQAKFWFHVFTMAAYATPVLGSFLADVLWGKYLTIMRLSLIYCLGHLVLAMDSTRFGLSIGLALIALGSGGIKPCVSAHVGDQFGSLNKHLLPKVFAWFYLAINVGAFVSGLLTPKILEVYGPHAAFGLPGALMLLATWVFWLGRYEFVHIPPAGPMAFADLSTTEGLQALSRVALLFVFTIPFWALFDQQGSSWTLQARYMDRRFLGIEWHEAQIQNANALLILIFVPTFTYGVYPFLGLWFHVTPLRKMGIGLFIMVFAYVLIARIEETMTGGRIETASSEAGGQYRERLIDGDTANPGWASDELKPNVGSTTDLSKDNQFVMLRLRESRPWTVDTIVLHPSLQPDKPDGIDHRACRPQLISLQVSDAPKGSWTEVARLRMEQVGGAQSFVLPQPIHAPYVKLEFLSNYGGKRIELAEIELFAVEESATHPTPPRAGLAALAKELRPTQARTGRTDANVAAIGERPSIRWQLLAYFILSAAEVMVSITSLEFAYTQAPRTMKSIIMTLYLLSISFGNGVASIVNFVNQRADGTTRLPGAQYFWFFAGMMLLAAIAFAGVAAGYRERSYIQGEEEKPSATE